MNKFIPILIVTLSQLPCSGQATKLITNKFPGSRQIAECYSVLKSDGTTRHGEYVSYFKISDMELRNKKIKLNLESLIRQKGSFKNGKKEGLWMEYSSPMVLLESGNFGNGKRVGIWEIHKERNQVIEKYDYDNNKRIGITINAFVLYPEKEMGLNVEGIVTLSYRVSEDCSVTDIQVVKSLSPECDKSAIATIKTTSELSKKYGLNCEAKAETKQITFNLIGNN